MWRLLLHAALLLPVPAGGEAPGDGEVLGDGQAPGGGEAAEDGRLRPVQGAVDEDGLVEDADDPIPGIDPAYPTLIPSTPSYEEAGWRSSPAPHCSSGSNPSPTPQNRFLIILAKMDGELIALDAGNNGQVVWRLNTDANSPLLSSTLSDVELISNDETFRLIPSLDGNLYMYQSSGVMQAIPVSSESLMSSSLRFGQDVVAGGRTVSTHGLNILTGQLHYSCGLGECDRAKLSPEQMRNNVVVRRVSQTVRALEPRSGQEKWNVSVGELELMLSDGLTDSAAAYASSCHQDDSEFRAFWQAMADVRFVINPPTGYVAAYSRSNPERIIWETYLRVPIAQAWELREWGLGQLSLFDAELVPGLSGIGASAGSDLALQPDSPQYSAYSQAGLESLVYLGTYKRELYVIPSPAERRKVRLLQLTQATANDRRQQLFTESTHELVPQSPERLYLPEPDERPPAYTFPALPTGEPSPTGEQCHFESCPTCSTEQAHALIARQQELNYDAGWYLYKHKARDLPLKTKRWMMSPNTIQKAKNIKEAIKQSLLDLALDWWRSLLLVLLSALGTGAASAWWYRHHRPPVLTSTAEGETETPLKESGDIPDWLLPKQASDSSGTSTASTASRFLEDYTPVKMLGRGGFGTVYEARHKLDGHAYAVKRVPVAAGKRKRRVEIERVSREVSALASLHHPGIVRYFYAWFESYPPDLLRQVEDSIASACGEPISSSHLSSSLGTESRKRTEMSSLCADLNANLQHKLDLAKEHPIRLLDSKDDSGLSGEDSTASDFELSSKDISSRDPSSRDTSDPSSRDPSRMDGALLSKGHRVPPELAPRSLEIVFADTGSGGNESEIKESVKGSLDGGFSPSPERLYLFITMQLCQESTLGLWLRENAEAESRVSALMLDWFAQILSAVEYVHDFGLIHRDLKPSNIFFDEREHLKVGDFGLATTMEEYEAQDGDSDHHGQHTADVGTRLYMSPEQLSGQPYTASVDVYSLGLILLEILVPFKTEMERRTALSLARRLQFPSSLSSESFSRETALLRRLLAPEPEERPTCAAVREDALFQPFFSDAQWIRSLSAPASLPRLRGESSRSRSNNSSSKDSTN